MSRLLVALAAVAGLSVAHADEPKGVRGQKLAKIQKKFDADLADLEKRAAAATDNEDKTQVAFLIKELHAFAAADAVELAEENKKDDTALDAAVYALKLLGKAKLANEDFNKAVAVVAEGHIDDPKIGPVLEMMSTSPAGRNFLETVREKALNKEVQALAQFYTAAAMDSRAGQAEANGNDEAATKIRDEAADLMEKAAKLSPETKVNGKSLADLVKAELVSLRIGVGKPAPDIEGTDTDGKKVKLSSFKGKVVLFDFWATWCPPCVAMIPHERDLVKRMEGKPFALLSVNVDSEKSALTEFLQKEAMPWSHWYDGAGGPVTKMFRIQAYPTLFLIDEKGVIRKKWIGNPGNDKLDKAIEELVAAAGKK